MLGFVLAAVSPAVVVPCLLALQARGLGVDKGETIDSISNLCISSRANNVECRDTDTGDSCSLH